MGVAGGVSRVLLLFAVRSAAFLLRSACVPLCWLRLHSLVLWQSVLELAVRAR